MDREELQKRTYAFALRVVRMVKTWQYDLANKCIGDQLVRAATSVAANYRAARRSRSDREFLAKMSIVVEEVDESLFWLSLAIDAQCVSVEKAGLLRDEADARRVVVDAIGRQAALLDAEGEEDERLLGVAHGDAVYCNGCQTLYDV